MRCVRASLTSNVSIYFAPGYFHAHERFLNVRFICAPLHKQLLQLRYCVLRSTENSRLNTSATYTVCLPASCADQLHVAFAKHNWNEAVDEPNVQFCKNSRKSWIFYVFLEDGRNMLVCIVIQLVILLPLMAYLYLRYTKASSTIETLSLRLSQHSFQSRSESKLRSIIEAIALNNAWRRLTSHSSDQIACIQILRVINVLWVIVGSQKREQRFGFFYCVTCSLLHTYNRFLSALFTPSVITS